MKKTRLDRSNSSVFRAKVTAVQTYNYWCIAVSLVALLCFVTAAPAEVLASQPLLHPLFCDHAVLQRDVAVPVWGWSAPGAKISVSFAGQTRTTRADKNGRWLLKLKSMRASSESRPLSVTNFTTHEFAVAKDVLVGDVWLCSGQSNMEMGVGACNATNDIATANFPLLRLLTVPHRVATEPADTLVCQWLPCSPENIKQGLWAGFSATGFFFGRELHRELNVPIGLIHSSWGGTVAEAWTSAQGLESITDFRDAVQNVRDTAADKKHSDYIEIFEKWCQQKDGGTKQGWASATTFDATWRLVAMPQYFEQAGLPDYDGIVWFSREFELPTEWAGKDVKLELGQIDDIDTTWVNGVKVGQMNRYDLFRNYTIPASALKSSKNIVTIRVLDTGGNGGFMGPADRLKFSLAGDDSAAPVSLAGNWLMHDSTPLAQLGVPPQIPDPGNPNVTTVLYNGMIAPLLPFAIKGAIWYQGESNADRAKQYRRLLPAMINDWRHHFGVGEFPFYIVQLAAFQATNAAPRENNWAELREAQALTAKNFPNCGLALAVDIGDANDIHPKNKQEVGRRLALAALAQTYGKKIENSGPWYRSMKVSGGKIRLKFDHIGGGLVAKGDKLIGFAIAGADHKFVWAEAVIDGKAVVVSSPEIARPVAVRYAWDTNPVCNLYNQAGLPAVPFRTDEPSMTTK